MRSLSSVVTSVSKISFVIFRDARVSCCAVSAGSCVLGASRKGISSVPPYCGRVSACAPIVSSNRLLAASNGKPECFISPHFSISHHHDSTVTFRFRPEGCYFTGQIHRGAHCDRIAVWKLVGSYAIVLVALGIHHQHLPSRAATSVNAGEVAAPFCFL